MPVSAPAAVSAAKRDDKKVPAAVTSAKPKAAVATMATAASAATAKATSSPIKPAAAAPKAGATATTGAKLRQGASPLRKAPAAPLAAKSAAASSTKPGGAKHKASSSSKVAAAGAGASTSGRPAAAAAGGPSPQPQPYGEAHTRAAVVIQAAYRGRKARKLAARQRDMEALRVAAWQAQVEYERKQEAKRRKAAEEEARRKKAEAALRKKLLEAAYDGEDDALQSLLASAADILPGGRDAAVDLTDAHGNTMLSEAAAAGNVSTVQLLLSLGADPNSRGEFKRTPLWRSSFLGKADVVPLLLAAGADPRLGNEAGEEPAHVAATPGLKATLGAWDLGVTDALAAQRQALLAERAAQAAAAHVAAVTSAEQQLVAAKADQEAANARLKHARCELERRIHEHDVCVVEKKGDTLVSVTLEQVHLAETALEVAKRAAAEAAEAVQGAKLRLRERQAEGAPGGGDGGGDTAAAAGADPLASVGVVVDVTDLDEVLIKDVGSVMARDGRWPLVVDPAGLASCFLRYLDTNYVNLLSSAHVSPPSLRRSVLGAIRYGKPLVVDMMEVDMWSDSMEKIFDAVQPRLLADLLDRSLLRGEAYLRLVRQPGDGEEYDATRFQDTRIANFKLVVLTAQRAPNEAMLDKFYVVRVRAPAAGGAGARTR